MKIENNYHIKKLDKGSLSDVKRFLHQQNPFDAIFFDGNEQTSEIWGNYDSTNRLVALLALREESHNVLWNVKNALEPLRDFVRSQYSTVKTSGQMSKIVPWLEEFHKDEVLFMQEGFACVLGKENFRYYQSPKVRKASLKDIDRLLWLFPKDTNAEQKKIEFSVKHTKVFILEESGLIVSVARTDIETTYGSHIVGVATHPDFRGHGYATYCVSALCDELLKKNQRVFLAYTTDNDAAGKVYNKIGFEKLSERRMRARLQF